jgi:hypothetical protein
MAGSWLLPMMALAPQEAVAVPQLVDLDGVGGMDAILETGMGGLPQVPEFLLICFSRT